MEERKGNRGTVLLILDVIVSLVLWAILICLKAAGVVDMHWALVLSGIVWISWLLLSIDALAATIVWALAKLKHWHRRRKTDARIIRQAKAAGVWDKMPIVLGGRALELKVQQDFKMKRKPGETDRALRCRYMEVQKCAAIISKVKEQTKSTAAALGVHKEVLMGEWTKESKQKQEGERINE